jgi:hypothetical protein
MFRQPAIAIVSAATVWVAASTALSVAAEDGTLVSTFQFGPRLQRVWIVRSQDNPDGSKSAVLKVVITMENQPDASDTYNIKTECGLGPVHEVVVDDGDPYRIDENGGPNRRTLWLYNAWWALCRGELNKFG